MTHCESQNKNFGRDEIDLLRIGRPKSVRGSILPSHERPGHVLIREKLPEGFPSHSLDPEFLERLGRTIAAFGFLEEMLGKAIFALTATRTYPEEEIQKKLDYWLPTLLNALSDSLQNLIEKYLKELKNHPDNQIENIPEFEEGLKALPPIRNAFCHGSWRPMNEEGFTKPYYCTKNGDLWDEPVDAAYLKRVEGAATSLAIDVINSVTVMGWSFPGSGKAGRPIVSPSDTRSKLKN